MTNSISVSLKYISHIKPIVKLGAFNTKIVMSRQLLYFFLFLTYFSSSQLFIKFIPHIFIMKKKKKFPNFLRAPYRHKKAQINLKSSFYFIYLKFSISFNQLILSRQCFSIIKYLTTTWLFCDSPFISLYRQNYALYTHYNCFV